MPSGILWKPISESDGNLVVLFPYQAGRVVIRDGNSGEVIAEGRSTGASNGFADTIRFGRPGSAFNNVIVEDATGRRFRVSTGSNRIEDIAVGDPGGSVIDAPIGAPATSPFPGSVIPGTNVVLPGLIDPSLIQFNPISFNPINFTPIDPANFNFTDPLESAKKTAEFNKTQSDQNFLTGIDRGREVQRQELLGIQEFATGISDTQRQLIEQENAFNQAQRLQAVEFAIPGVQDTFRRQRERAETLASGRLLSTAEDRAFELASRSVSADGTFTRGFGDDSVVGRRQSEILSAQQRLGLTQIGENFLSRSLQQAAGLLVDTPLKANISQRLPAQPNVPLASIVGQQQQIENQLTTINPATALQAQIGQEQFQTNLEQSTNIFNAQTDLSAQQFNSSGQQSVDQFNSNGLFQQSQLQFNALVSNQDRINAALQAAQNQIREEEQAIADAEAAGAGIDAATAANDAAAAGVSSGFGAGQATGAVAGAAGALGGVAGIASAAADVIEIGGQVIDTIFGDGSDLTPAPITQDDINAAAEASGVDVSGFDTASVGIDGADTGIVIPAGEDIPAGFEGVQSNADGSTVAIPRERASAENDALGASNISAGATEFGNFVTALGSLGVGSAELAQVGGIISAVGGVASQILGNQSVQSAAASGDRVELANQLEAQALSATDNPDDQNSIRETFNEVRNALQTGSQLSGFAAQTLSFVNNFSRLSDTQRVRGFYRYCFTRHKYRKSPWTNGSY